MSKFGNMGSSYTKKYSSRLKSDLKKVSNLSARKHLLKWGYSSSSFGMPDYYRPEGLGLMKLPKIEWNLKKMPAFTKTLDVFTPKSHLSWRSFNFLNPYIFFHLVEEITKKDNWKLIVDLLTQETLVYSYSTPVFGYKKGETTGSKAVLNWLQMVEKDIIKDCSEYNFLTITDVKNFYPTIYTHSIGWAIHGKGHMKVNRKDYTLLGNKLDKLFQNSRDGQTNGIPVGAMTSDIIAELILTDVDKKLSEKIRSERLSSQVIICRFRDDYRILSKTHEQGKRVLSHLNRILNIEYDLNINSDKTEIHNDVIEASFRPWMVEIKNSLLLRKVKQGDIEECLDANYLKDCLIETYRIQKKFLNSRASISILSKLAEGLFYKNKNIKYHREDIPEIISLLRKISLLREEVTPQVFLILDILLKNIATKRDKRAVLSTIRRVISGKNDQDYQLIWFYRLCLSVYPEMCDNILDENKSPILRVVDRKYYKYDFNIFDRAALSVLEENELEKFSFIDRKKIGKSSGLQINPKSISIFKY